MCDTRIRATYTLEQAARRIGVTGRTLKRWLGQGTEIPLPDLMATNKWWTLGYSQERMDSLILWHRLGNDFFRWAAANHANAAWLKDHVVAQANRGMWMTKWTDWPTIRHWLQNEVIPEEEFDALVREVRQHYHEWLDTF